MKRILSTLVLVVASAACSPAEQLSTTTTSSIEVTSTSLAATTTSTAPATTTTPAPPTTTTALLEGNWAEQPVITSNLWAGVLGWWDGSTWVHAMAGMELPVQGGEDYQIALLGTEGSRTTGGTRVTACEVHSDLDQPGVELADPDLLAHPLVPGEESALEGVAISAGWDLTPNHVGDGEAHPDLEAMGIGLLAQRGFETDAAPIVQTVDADLDGDGAIETIVVIEDTELGNEGSGVYSLVFVVEGGLDQPIVIDESVIPADESGFPASFRVGAVADLSGDGLMEVVLDGVAWENSWLTVYELVDGGFIERISAGCGV